MCICMCAISNYIKTVSAYYLNVYDLYVNWKFNFLELCEQGLYFQFHICLIHLQPGISLLVPFLLVTFSVWWICLTLSFFEQIQHPGLAPGSLSWLISSQWLPYTLAVLHPFQYPDLTRFAHKVHRPVCSVQ